MTKTIEQEALDLINEVFSEREYPGDSCVRRASNSYHEAICRALEAQSQISQLADDDIKDAYRRGRYDGRVQGHISEGRWWCFGVMCGVVLSVLVWIFWP